MSLFHYQEGKTRIKICGLTTAGDVEQAKALNIDAFGLVLYPPSPRFIEPSSVMAILGSDTCKLQKVALVVDASDDLVNDIKKYCEIDIWQFHGNETPDRCRDIAGTKPWMKAARIDEKFILDEFCLQYRDADAWLLDAVVDGYGGGGKTFNWDLIPQTWIKENAHRVVLSGGLNVSNVTEAIEHFRPLAVDVSSGVEIVKGIKDFTLMTNFVMQVRATDRNSGK
jgi:phosphoribosylanthranilate isomerase